MILFADTFWRNGRGDYPPPTSDHDPLLLHQSYFGAARIISIFGRRGKIAVSVHFALMNAMNCNEGVMKSADYDKD